MNLAAELAEEVTRKISRECEKWTKRCDDAKRIPDALFDFAPAMIREALVALAEREAWQPIASAPKDGTPILIFDPTKPSVSNSGGKAHDDPRFAIGYYRTWYPDGAEWVWGNRNDSYCSPTHWMRLPAPPTKENADG
jgi:hypothetical protein